MGRIVRQTLTLYTRYPIVARALALVAAFRPSARTRKCILHTTLTLTPSLTSNLNLSMNLKIF